MYYTVKVLGGLSHFSESVRLDSSCKPSNARKRFTHFHPFFKLNNKVNTTIHHYVFELYNLV